MRVTPLIRTPATDLFGSLITFQSETSVCGQFEIKAADCLEAYGVIKGKEKCADILADFRECVTKGKQYRRNFLMGKERTAQHEAGVRPEKYEPGPPVDSY